MTARRLVGLAAAAVTLAAAGACMPAGPGPGDAPTPTGTTADGGIPPGYGSLRQADVTLTVAAGPVQIRVTPLDESILRLTAPDTWQRLSPLRERAGAPSDARVFLVSVQTEEPGGADFDPRDLEILSRGVLHRATDIVALTPEWGSGRLRQRTPQQALYVFPGAVDPDLDMTIQVGPARSAPWADRLPLLEAERARVRARAGIGGGTTGRQPSSPNFLILR